MNPTLSMRYIMVRLYNTKLTLSHTRVLSWTAAALLATATFGCSNEQEDHDTNHTNHADDDAMMTLGAFDCEAGKDGWEMCDADVMMWCHAVEDNAHFHAGKDCAASGLTCYVDAQHRASCVDPATTCTEGEFKCEDNVAMNCVDGHWASRSCGIAKQCQVTETDSACLTPSSDDSCGGHGVKKDTACECDPFYAQPDEDPNTCVLADPAGMACDAFEASEPHTATAAATPGESLAPMSHAALLTRTDVTLLANQPGYIHFPVTRTGTYVVMASKAGVVAGVADKDGERVTSAEDKKGPNPNCSDALVEHWHAHIEYTGEPGSKIPHVIEFNSVDDASVSVLVFFKGE